MYIVKKIKHAFRRSSVLLLIYSFSQRINYRKTKSKMDLRKDLNIFSYKEISKPLRMLFIDKYPENNLYGMSYIIKEFIGIESKYLFLNSYIEHGLFFGNYVAKYSYQYPVDKIISFGNYRKQILGSDINIIESKKEIRLIGPYIAYARPLLDSNELKSLKKTLGKTLLVFPSHSIDKMTTQFDNTDFTKEILRIKKNNDFKTVIISMYWKDICEKAELCRVYEDLGFKIVCSGHKNDIYFLSRQKSIIELSDITMSNEVGTHIGYCIFLEKPHYLYSQEISYKESLAEVIKAENINNDLMQSQLKDKFILGKAFSSYSEEINEEQKKIVDYYWGTSNIKNNLKDLL